MDNKRMTLVYRNSLGNEIELGDNKPFIFLKSTGLDSMNIQPQYEKAPFQLGRTFIANDINERSIVITFAMISETESQQESYRRFIHKVFNPLLEGVLIIKGSTEERAVDVTIVSTPRFKDEDYTVFGHIMECQVSLSAPDGFIRDLNSTAVELTQVVPMIEFPFESPLGTSFELGNLNQGVVNFYNDGEAPTPFIVEIYGATKTPKIINKTTGEFIEVKIPLVHGDKLVINTSFSNKEVILHKNNGEVVNAFHYININSKFFQFDIGDNFIEFDAEEGNDTASITIYYKKKWSGI